MGVKGLGYYRDEGAVLGGQKAVKNLKEDVKTILEKVKKAVEEEAMRHPAAFPRVLPTSAEKPLGPLGGMEALRDAVARVLLGMSDDFGDMFA